jgi:DNA-binding MarR family transcriptional regulator
MSAVSNGDADAARLRRRLAVTIKGALRELRNQLSLLNHQVSTQVELKDVDLDCLELIAMHGPLGPSAVARRAGLHPATVTGILDRLQRGGWIVRERDAEAADRRAVNVRALPDRNRELFRLYSGMNESLDEICARYTDAELALIGDFLRRTTDAGRTETDVLARGGDPAQKSEGQAR